MQAKLKIWNSRNSVTVIGSDEDIQNHNENAYFKLGKKVCEKMDPAIPCIYPRPLKRINATFNLIKDDLSLKN